MTYIDNIRTKLEGLDKDRELAYFYVLGNIIVRKYMAVRNLYSIITDDYKRDLSMISRRLKNMFILNIRDSDLTQLLYKLLEANVSYLDINSIPGKINRNEVLHHYSFGIRESVPSDIKSIIKENEEDLKKLITYFIPWLNSSEDVLVRS